MIVSADYRYVSTTEYRISEHDPVVVMLEATAGEGYPFRYRNEPLGLYPALLDRRAYRIGPIRFRQPLS